MDPLDSVHTTSGEDKAKKKEQMLLLGTCEWEDTDCEGRGH